MSIFSRLRARKEARALNRELGEGLWRRAHDRFVRALDRYHQMLDGVDDVEAFNELAELGNRLADLLVPVRELCVHCQREHPSDELTVPNECRKVHAHLSSGANALATCAEAAALFRMRQVPISQVHFRSEKVFLEISEAHEELQRKLGGNTDSEGTGSAGTGSVGTDS